MTVRATPAARRFPGRVILVGGLVLLIGSMSWLSREPSQTVAQAPAASPSAASRELIAAPKLDPLPPSITKPAANSSTAAAPMPPAWPASLRDSAPDGAVTLDAQGRVRPSMELRRLFDYFLSAIGELDLAAIRALLLAHVRSLHGDAIASDAAALFDRYVAFQQAQAAADVPTGQSQRDRLAQLKELRRRLLDADMAEAFFGAEERYTEYTLARREIATDSALDDATRRRRIDELEAQLAPEQRAQMREANTPELVAEQNRQFETLALDAATRQSEREALFGAEAADRLAQLDAERVAWDARVASYRQARDALRADTGLDPVARDRAITQLRARSFDEAEHQRIAALEAIGQL